MSSSKHLGNHKVQSDKNDGFLVEMARRFVWYELGHVPAYRSKPNSKVISELSVEGLDPNFTSNLIDVFVPVTPNLMKTGISASSA